MIVLKKAPFLIQKKEFAYTLCYISYKEDRLVTIEVTSNFIIVQTKRKRNEKPTEHELKLISDWAWENNLKFTIPK